MIMSIMLRRGWKSCIQRAKECEIDNVLKLYTTASVGRREFFSCKNINTTQLNNTTTILAKCGEEITENKRRVSTFKAITRSQYYYRAHHHYYSRNLIICALQ